MDLAALDRISATTTPTVAIVDAETECTIWAKLEYEMPSGSTKDRIAARILAEAATTGELTDESVVVEASSGSTSIAFAMAVRRDRCALHRGDARRRERRAVDDDPPLRRRSGVDAGRRWHARRQAAAEAMGERDANVYLPRQFANPQNTEAHRLRTGPELIAQVGRPLDGFVAAVGTAGTLMGVGAALRAAQGDGRRVGGARRRG